MQRFILSRGVLVAFLVGIVFSPLCFAQDVTSSSVSSIGTLFQGIISSLSWLWIIFAVMAGKFMTNSVVYGSFLHLDQFFFHWWGLMRDIANFSLFGILLYQIIKAMISGAAAKFKNIIKNVLIAGVAIQASWFLTGALLDFSTVLVASFGTLPSQVISSNKSLQKDFSTTMQDLLKKKTTLYVDSMDTNNKYTKKDINEDEVKNMLDTITPTHNSLS